MSHAPHNFYNKALAQYCLDKHVEKVYGDSYNAKVYNLANALELNILDVAGDISSIAYCMHLDSAPLYDSVFISVVHDDGPGPDCDFEE